MTKSGFVAIIGRPNAGKSSLLNSLLTEKVAIVSDKAQTTRNSIRGIYNDEDSQIVFIDTPGIHKPHHQLGQQMNREAYFQAGEVDLLYLIVDASIPFGKGDEFILKVIKQFNLPTFLLLNKIDLLNKLELFNFILAYKDRYDFTEIIPISALKKDNLNTLIQVTKQYLPEGIKYYPEDIKSELSINFKVSETIREKVLILTEQEIPHSVAVIIEDIKRNNQALHINALIVVERDSQKAIILGKNGQMIKKIGEMARLEIEGFLKKKVFLELFVRVEKDWRNRQNKLKQFGYLTNEE